ncbi:MAG: glycosyltransferase [Candidatus Levybacteria bacterium]|nr:glycosyltransferase [Candidatus Levybacteria bacterium]
MKVALVYDRVNKWGGAERVLLALHKIFPDAPLFTSVYDREHAPWARIFQVKPSFLQRFPFAQRHHELYASLMPLAFEEMTLDGFELVISVTSEAAKGILTKPYTKHICYCLTPTRYLWSGYDEYFPNAGFRSIASPAISYLRRWDLQASVRPDALLAISQEVKNRIQKYYKRDAAIVYPPVQLAEKAVLSRKQKQSDFYLVVSRLVPYKRVDLAIQACNKLQKNLKIVGVGSEETRLKSMAGPTIQFLGNLTDIELVEYYRSCKALIFPGKEDFGLVVVEAQGFGKPVIAYKGGGALETIIDRKTGLFFDRQNAASLTQALVTFERVGFHKEACRKNAEQFSFKHFKTRFLSIIAEVR